MEHPLLVFSTAKYAYMERGLCATGGFERGVLERARFPDGERYLRLRTALTDRDVALVGGTVSDQATLELFDLGCAIAKNGARSLTLVVPYFGYSTMERAVLEGEVVIAKNRARLLSAIPLSASGLRVLLLDLHSEGIPYYFEGGIRPLHIYAKPLIHAEARRLGGDDFVLACTDSGRAKWVESLANDLGVPASFVFKRRLSGSATEITAVSAQVQGRRVVIYDDMIRTGGSLLGAARAYLDAGATEIAAIATHGLFPGDALERIEGSGLLTTVVCTDSHPRAVELGGGFLKITSLVELLTSHLAG